MTILTFDIEAIPSDNPEVIAKIAERIKPPANYKKPETIKQWMDENYDNELKQAVAKTTLDGAYGKVACISWTHGGDEIKTAHTIYANEELAIRVFYEYISRNWVKEFCGHNIHGFDLPFLKHRSMVLGIKPPRILLNAMNIKPWNDCIQDTMLMWSSDKNKMIGLDTLCWILGIESNSEMDGSEVAETWFANPQKVIGKCENDVRKTKLVYERMTFSNSVF